MKQRFLSFFLSFVAVLFMASFAQAQVISNSFTVSPPPGPFNPFGKFVALGESGGAPGPTANGCDLYGFRAQADPVTAVNLGMQDPFGGGFQFLPTLSFEAPRPFTIQQQNAGGPGPGFPTGCGKVLAWYFDGLGGGPAVVYSVFGDAFASGGTWIPSDVNLKRNIKPVKNALNIVNQLNGVTYNYRTDEYPDLNLREGIQYGFLAQDVQKVMPEATQAGVNTEGATDDYIIMNYDMIIPVLTEAIKLQQTEIEEQRSEIELLKSEMAELRNLIRGDRSNSTGTADRATLGQNRPNPTNGLTTVDYSLEADMDNAQLVVYNAAGVAVKNLPLRDNRGSVDIDTNELAAGVYFYTIENNGKSLARQKMVVK